MRSVIISLSSSFPISISNLNFPIHLLGSYLPKPGFSARFMFPNTRAARSCFRLMGRIIMNSMKFPASMLLLLLVFLAANAIAQDNDPLGSAPNAAVNEDVGKSMADDLFSPVQDMRGVPTPVLMGKNVPAAQESTKPKARLLSPSNKWHLDLQDTKDRVLDLELFQSNDAVFGNGTIVVDGVSQYVTATGTIYRK